MKTSRNMEEYLHMNSGTGESSYAQNSAGQKRGLEHVRPVLEQSILSMEFLECKTFCIAELGCSSGPNALLPAQNIIKTLEAKYLAAGDMPLPQIQVFFNDLPSSDFNTLFRTLPPSVVIDRNEATCLGAARSYFAAGVPGSFYGRLFPDKSLHFLHSSYALHWLSQVPPKVLEKNSVTWNKGKITAGGSPAVGEAFFRQFQKDFNGFLRARAEEMVGGGRMFLLLMGLISRNHPPSHPGWEYLESSLNHLVSQGLIEEEKVDSFNLPLFIPCKEEVRNEIVSEGSFEIQRLELLTYAEMSTKKQMEVMSDSALAKEAYGKLMAKQMRAMVESLLKYHFGDYVMEALFQRYGQIIGERLSEMIEYGERAGLLVLVLERVNEIEVGKLSSI